MNRTFPRLASAAALTLLLAGCGEQPEPAGGMLGHVPADTPYVFVSSRPMPADFRERLMRHNAAQYDRMLADWREMREQMTASAPQAELPPEFRAMADVMDALLAELAGAFTEEGVASLGLRDDALAVVYGLGVFPVARLEIRDATLVEALLARIEERSGHRAEQQRLQGIGYRRIPLGQDMVLIVSVQPEALLLGMLPLVQEQRWLPLVLGLERPERALAETDTMPRLLETYGFQGYGDGYIDLRTLGRILTGAHKGRHGEIWAALQQPTPSSACRQLVDGLTAAAPRMVMGIEEVNADSYVLTAAQETSPQLTTHLKGLSRPQPLPGMGVSGDYLGSFGIGIDPQALREGLIRLLRYVAGHDGCEWVDPHAIEQLIPMVNLTLGPMLKGFSGVYAELIQVEVNREFLQPENLVAGLLLGVEDPQGALGLAAAMLNPALLDLSLPLDGSAVAVPAAMLPPDVPPLHLAAKPGLLAIAVGEGGAPRASALLAAPVAETPLLISANFDVAAFMGSSADLLAMFADRLEAEGQAEQARELRVQVAEMKAQAAAGGSVQFSLAPDRRGLLMRQRVRLP